MRRRRDQGFASEISKQTIEKPANGQIPSGMTEFEWMIVFIYLKLLPERLQHKLDRDRTMIWITEHKFELTDMIGVSEKVEDAVGKLFLKLKMMGHLEGFGHGLTW